MNIETMTLVTTQKRDCNTFSFYASIVGKKIVVVVNQFTDFSNTILADEYPNGENMKWSTSFPKTVSMCDAVNMVGKKLLKEWSSITLG
jgi:hypothetical protein